jgi:CubicO group peptidase (beta-lactamase class C family)
MDSENSPADGGVFSLLEIIWEQINTPLRNDMRKILAYCSLLFLILVTSCASPKPISLEIPEPEYWPTSGWKHSTPEAQGMDSGLLAQMLEVISAEETSLHSVIVVRNGYLVTEAYFHPYTSDTKMHLQSVTKSVIGMLVGIALKKGMIPDIDQPVIDFFRNRRIAYLDEQKESIQLKHLLSMSSGLDCAEFSSGPRMEQTPDWVQFMLDRPVTQSPGETFGYCNGNAHLLSAILEKTSGLSTREFANRELFQPLGIAPVEESDWEEDPQGFATGGYGLHLRPADLAKLALLYLNSGKWNGQQIIPAQWVSDSLTQHVQKEDGSGYGYLWTVYPEADHYAALGLGGQQVHLYPSKNLIVVVTASLESYAEAPEIEKILHEYILPAIESDEPLAENLDNISRLHAAIKRVAKPFQSVPPLPVIAGEISESVYTFTENPMGWESLAFHFEEGAPTAQLQLSDFPLLEIGLDNLYRLSGGEAIGELLLRGRWTDEQTFVIDYPYPAVGGTTLGELGETEFRFKFLGDELEVTVEQMIFADEPIVVKGSRK